MIDFKILNILYNKTMNHYGIGYIPELDENIVRKLLNVTRNVVKNIKTLNFRMNTLLSTCVLIELIMKSNNIFSKQCGKNTKEAFCGNILLFACRKENLEICKISHFNITSLLSDLGKDSGLNYLSLYDYLYRNGVFPDPLPLSESFKQWDA